VVEHAPGARVNVVAPGWTATPMAASRLDEASLARATATMALRKVGLPEDVAAAIAFPALPGRGRPRHGPGRHGRGRHGGAPAARAAGPGLTRVSLWRPDRRQLLRLLVGLWVFGVGEALVVASELGNSPWTVFAEGLSRHSPLTIGTATVLTSFVLLLIWIPLGVRPGLGTIANAVLIGIVIDLTLAVLDRAPLGVRVGELLAGIVLVGVGSGLYLNAALGPGTPRRADDGAAPVHGTPRVAAARRGSRSGRCSSARCSAGRSGSGPWPLRCWWGPRWRPPCA
jgi:hypothetical protein